MRREIFWAIPPSPLGVIPCLAVIVGETVYFRHDSGMDGQASLGVLSACPRTILGEVQGAPPIFKIRADNGQILTTFQMAIGILDCLVL